jgi:hypothetical protein
MEVYVDSASREPAQNGAVRRSLYRGRAIYLPAFLLVQLGTLAGLAALVLGIEKADRIVVLWTLIYLLFGAILVNAWRSSWPTAFLLGLAAEVVAMLSAVLFRLSVVEPTHLIFGIVGAALSLAGAVVLAVAVRTRRSSGYSKIPR